MAALEQLLHHIHPNPQIYGLIGPDAVGKTHNLSVFQSSFKPNMVISGTNPDSWAAAGLSVNDPVMERDDPRRFYMLRTVALYACLQQQPETTWPILIDSEPIIKWLMWEIIQGQTLETAMIQIFTQLIDQAGGLIPGNFINVRVPGMRVHAQVAAIFGLLDKKANKSDSDPKSWGEVVAQVEAHKIIHQKLIYWRQANFIRMKEFQNTI